MIDDVKRLVESYSAWVRDRSAVTALHPSIVQITTPYLDRHNDCLQIYVERTGEGFRLTDGGETIADLKASGCELDTPKRKHLLTAALNGFGVKRDDRDQLSVLTTRESFPLRKHNLVQAMLAVNDMFYLAQPLVSSIFHEDVATWLKENEVRFTPNLKVQGKTGYDYTFDFAIPASRAAPERLLRALNRPTRDLAEAAVMAWIDTRDVREPDSQFYVVINDADRTVASQVLGALYAYDIRSILWSERDDHLRSLAA